MEFIDKEDLREPYSSLIDVLEPEEILNLEELWRGRQILFSSGIKNSDTYAELVRIIGADKADKVIHIFMGELIYFPKLKSLSVREKILQDFTGYNYTELSRKYGYSERYIREIVKYRAKSMKTVSEGQISLFDKNS